MSRKRLLGRLDRLEGDWVSGRLPAARPSRATVVLSLAARGGLLWWLAAAVLLVRPGRWRRAGRHAALAVGIALPASHLLGRLLLRRRPRAGDLPARRALPETPTSPALPSAHACAAAAFTAAAALQAPPVAALAAPVAFGVAYSRVRTRVHWPSDVLAGAALGVLVAGATRHLVR
ncbi:phosphatase PAP2 family protein [Amycolatopsis dongchuanensis]|uniref:Phosphatase PAP2 family protein n=1 Tax=Amycolatopsis dongchuanensis TaxID=1070866 RepID=A0ABP9R3V6_9PSEU